MMIMDSSPIESLRNDLLKYVREMGYTHVELMGIAEHPFDGFLGISGDGILCSDQTIW